MATCGLRPRAAVEYDEAMLTPDDLRRLYRQFDHTRPLKPEDLDLFVGRPGGAADLVAEELRERLEPQGKWVICGSIGCGKSSELVQLGRLVDTSHAVVGLDLGLSVPRVDRLAPAEVVFLIGAAVVQAADQLWGHAIAADRVEGLLKAFNGVLSEEGRHFDVAQLMRGVGLFIASVAAPGVGAVKDAVAGAASVVQGAGMARLDAGGTPLGGLTRPLREGEADLRRLVLAVNAVVDEVRGYRDPVVLVDGLDKIQDTGVIRDLFIESDVLRAPEVPVVYAGPITLMVSPAWRAAGHRFRQARLPNLLAHQATVSWATQSSASLARGRAVLREIVERRVVRAGLTLDGVFAGEALDRLISRSGGVVRDLIHLVHRAVRRALLEKHPVIDEAAADFAIGELQKELEITLNTQRVSELVHIREQGEPSGSDVSLRLLLQGYALPFSNGRAWFEPHPLLHGLRPGL